MTDRVTEAFRRLLNDAKRGGQAKVDALLALTQRTLLLATWDAAGSTGYRTLSNANGQTALPVFSDRAELERAATAFSWRDPSGAIFSKEVGARAALNYA